MADRKIVVSPKLVKGISPARARALGISEDKRLAAVVPYASPPVVEFQLQPCTKEEKKSIPMVSANVNLGLRCHTRDDDERQQQQQQKTTAKPNRNAEITKIFLELSDIYKNVVQNYETLEASNNSFRSIQYKRVAHGLVSLNVQVRSGEDAVTRLTKAGKTKPGRSMIKDIDEIIKQGMCHRLKIFQEDTRCQAQLTLAKVFGIGPMKAKSLINKGIMSLEQLRQRQDLLTKEMKIGLKYIEDLQHRIPRSEVERIGSFIEREMKESLRTDGSFEIVGSYRRGELHCGDVDILLSPGSGESCASILSTLLTHLKSIGFISDTLKSPRLRKPERKQTWLGICHLPDPGSLHRMKAKKKGLILTDHGLHKRALVANGKSIRGTSEACDMEEDIFVALESPYIPPYERIV